VQRVGPRPPSASAVGSVLRLA